jgi:hypothetical protein
MQQDEVILTVAIFGHGCENLLYPFTESHPIGDFYKNNVRVFSQSCVPDIPSVTSEYEHNSIAKRIITEMQSSPESDTVSILEPYISSCKPKYRERFQDESIKIMHPKFDERLFDSQYNDRSCGTMSYLANKTFELYGTPLNERSVHLHGVVLLDVRLKKTFEDGRIEYKTIFAPGSMQPLILTSYDGLLYLLKNVLGKKTVKEREPYMKQFGLKKMGDKLTDVDLIKLFEIFKLFHFINILDYSCRSCSSGSRLSSREIEDIYTAEQHYSSLLPKFGGNRKRTKTQKKNKSKKIRQSKKNKK